MFKKEIPSGVVHDMPKDLRKALTSSQKTLSAWQGLSPLGRNEWICWTISVKKAETRENHIKRLVIEVANGKHRPCCWAGCTHR